MDIEVREAERCDWENRNVGCSSSRGFQVRRRCRLTFMRWVEEGSAKMGGAGRVGGMG